MCNVDSAETLAHLSFLRKIKLNQSSSALFLHLTTMDDGLLSVYFIRYFLAIKDLINSHTYTHKIRTQDTYKDRKDKNTAAQDPATKLKPL
jgi:hypothetical protein